MKEISTLVKRNFTNSFCLALFTLSFLLNSNFSFAAPGSSPAHGIEKGFTTVQSAISHAKAGSLVYIPAGIWDEHVIIDKPILLMPAAGAVLKDLEINAPGKTITLLGNLIVDGTLELKEGILNSGTFKVIAQKTINRVEESSAMMSMNVGTVTLPVNKNTDVTFPIGTPTDYTPVTVHADNNHTDCMMTLSVVDKANLGDFSDPPINYTAFAKYEWDASVDATPPSVKFDYQFPTTGVNIPLSSGATDIGHDLAHTWTFAKANLTSGGGNYTAASTATYTSLSPFGVFSCTAYNAALSTPQPYSICKGASAKIHVDVSGTIAAPYSGLYRDNNFNNITFSGYDPTTDSLSVSPTVTTTYHLISVTDANMCTATVDTTATVTITVHALPSCSISGTAGPVCPGSNNNYTASGGTSYSWSVTGDGTIDSGGSSATVKIKAGDVCNSSFTATVTVTDANGCTSSCSQVVTVKDVTGPLFSNSCNNITVNAANLLCGKSVGTLQGYPTIAATDNCSSVSISQTDGSGFTKGDFFPVGTTTQTYEATDSCGNKSTCSFNVIVVDNQNPIITGCPFGGNNTQITIYTSPGVCSADTTWVAPTASDNCPSVSMTANYAPGSMFPGKTSIGGDDTTKVVYTATDASNNTSMCMFIVKVIDNQPPVLTCPSNKTINCEVDTSAAMQGLATAVDACDASPSVGHTDSNASGSCTGNHVISRTWKATDFSGNTSTCVQTITVQDTTKPVITCPPNATINCSDNLTETGPAGNASATDNCGVPVVTHTDVSTQNTDANNCAHYNYTITRTFKATDLCGNTATCTQSITVHDVTAPTASNVTASGQCKADTLAIDPAVITDEADNCSPTTVTFIGSSNNGGSGCSASPFVLTRTFRVTDVCGNTTDVTQTVTIIDVQPQGGKAEKPTLRDRNDTTQTLSLSIQTMLVW